MMSVPAINPVLPSSGNQASKVGSNPATSSVTPLGLTMPQKMSVLPQQIANQNKPSLSVNHSSVPLSLVHENKISGVPAHSSLGKPSDKPKDLSPMKPTSNGVEPATKTNLAQTAQAQGNMNASNKPEEKVNEQGVMNHTDDAKSSMTPTAETSGEEGQNSPASNSSKADQSSNQTHSESSPETKVNMENLPSSSESGMEVKPVKGDAKATSGPNKRKREQKGEKKNEPVPEKKPQRIRSQVLPYQSPLPELATYINKSLKEKDASQKSSDEKLIVFYKNEFLAVRNAENGFYLCQTLQNVYRTSHRIRIRWLSQDKESNTIYTPDFYDLTDFECILTTVALEKLDKNKYKLPQLELDRTENILKRALDVEKGVSEKPPVTEEHPDGIDLSIYKDESQLQKTRKRKSKSPVKRSTKQSRKAEKVESKEDGAAVKEEPKKKRSKSRSKTEGKATKSTRGRAKTGKRGKSDSGTSREKSSKNVDQLKVSPPNDKARVVAKVLRKVEVTPATSKKTKSKRGKASKSNSRKTEKKNSKADKTATPSRSSERRASAATSRKRAGKK